MKESGIKSDLVLSAGTIFTYDLPRRISIASAAGYMGIGLRPEDYAVARERYSNNALRKMLEQNGVRVVEIQSIHGWAGSEMERAKGSEIEQGCYRLADGIGGDYMMVSQTNLEGTMNDAVERFAAICDRAAEYGLKVSIEFLPWGPIPDAQTAWQLVRESGRTNAGILVDSWHHIRGANDESQIREIPVERIFAIQISDAPKDIQGSLYDDTRNERLNPGDGSFNLTRFVRLLDELGTDLPYSVEILSNRQRALPPEVAARESALATWRVMESARKYTDTPSTT